MAVWEERSDGEPAVTDDTGGGAAAQKLTRRSTQTVTLKDVALHAGVSPQTVSRSIRSPHLVSASTLERVQKSIVDTGYVLNLAASNLASNRSQTVAAILPAISTSIFADALHGLDEVLSPHGYQLFIGATNYSLQREEELIRALLGRRPDGIFIVGTTHTEAASQMLKLARVPVVETWSLTDNPIHSVVGFSNREALRALLQYVVSKGYAHPAFAGSMQAGDARAVERKRGFERAMRGLLPNEPIRVVDSGTADIDLDTGRLLLHRVLDEHPETDVIMFSSDVFATGALLECARSSVPVPERVAITGFGDFDIARHVLPSLTTVAVPNREIGIRAGELLLKSMPDPTVGAEEIDLGFTIVARESA